MYMHKTLKLHKLAPKEEAEKAKDIALERSIVCTWGQMFFINMQVIVGGSLPETLGAFQIFTQNLAGQEKLLNCD